MNRNKEKVKERILLMSSHLTATDVTCHMGSHIVTCLIPASKLVLDLPTPEGWKAEFT